MAGTPEQVVVARGLVKCFGPLVAVDGIDFSVLRGECYGFLGPNGAGKTSTLKMIYGASPLTAGELRVLGLEVRRHARAIKRQIGVVPQETNLDPDLRVRQNLLTYGRYFDLPAGEAGRRADELLAFMELSAKAGARIDQLSGGMKRRLLVARALIHRPSLLLLDEPTTGLDPQARHLIWQRLRHLKRQGVTLILTTHYMEEAAQLCDRVMVMDRGRVLVEGAPQELVEGEVGREVVELRVEEREEAALLSQIPGDAYTVERSGDTLYIFSDRALDIMQALKAAQVGNLLYRPATLEDLFLKLTGRELRE